MPNRKKNYTDVEKYKNTHYSQRKRYYNKTAHRYPIRPWSYEEEQAVLRHDIPDSELSKNIQRSVAAIQVRRCYLKSLK